MNPGTRLGPYEILSPLGAGGMGEVFKARDTRLDRIVAVKLLPERLAGDAAARERFQREARAISRFNHPHICTLYDVGDDYLVMEFVEGQTLAQRLQQGPLDLDEALAYGAQVAEALARAHRAGIVHRDLKPANVMVTRGGVKLLDFGLAQPWATVHAGPVDDAETGATPVAPDGMILGTLQYMSPEQVEGRAVDHRSDIFACGVLLYEMVTGRRPFEGDTPSAVIAAVLRHVPPPMRTLRPATPPELDRLVATCLAKDPDERWQNSADLARALQWISQTQSSAEKPAGAALSVRGRRFWQGIAAALAITTALAAAAVIWRGTPQEPWAAYRTSVVLPGGLRFPVAGSVSALSRFALSPDGRQLAFVAVDESGTQMLWLRPLDALAAQVLPGTTGAASPFWSPDSRSIAFVAQGQLKRVDAAGGSVTVITEPAFNTPGSWGEADVILFRPTARAALHQVAATGGDAVPVPSLEPTHRSPFFLPGGRRFLFVAASGPNGSATAPAVYVASLDGQQPPQLLLENASDAKFAGGHLLFLRERTLLARPFDPDDLTFAGEAATLAEGIDLVGGALGAFSVTDGLLAYQPEAGQGTQLMWFDRGGRPLGTVADPANYGDVELSPDGRQAAVSILDFATNTRDIWLVDLARGVRSRLTNDPAEDVAPIWSSDGTRVLFTSSRRGHFDLYVKPAGGVGSEQLVYADDAEKYPTSWSPDGLSILFWTFDTSGTDLWVLQPGDEGKPRSLLGPGPNPGRFSPDGRWVAYYSSESGRSEVYVTPFPGASRRWQVSTTGGNFSRWAANGREIVYASQNRLMRVAIDVARDGSIEAGTPSVLFAVRPVGPRYFYDITPDGQRLLVNTLRDETASASVTLVQQWTASLPQ